HPLAADPVFVGAAQDGITLSEDASSALRHSLPDFRFRPDAPMADAVIDTPLAPGVAAHGEEPDEAADHTGSDAPGEAASGRAGPAGTGAAGTDAGANDPTAGDAESNHGSASNGTHADALEPPAPRPGTASQLPGMVAGVAIVVL